MHECPECGWHGDPRKEYTSCPNCGVSFSYGRGGKVTGVRVSGKDHTEVAAVATQLSQSKHHSPLLASIARATFWCGAFLAVLGIVLVALGSSGKTNFTFFGQQFHSDNVGIAAIFLGAAMIVLNIRRLLKSADKEPSK
jgi:hypothetical protein